MSHRVRMADQHTPQFLLQTCVRSGDVMHSIGTDNVTGLSHSLGLKGRAALTDLPEQTISLSDLSAFCSTGALSVVHSVSFRSTPSEVV